MLVSKEGRITLLGGLDLDPTRTGVMANIIFKKQGVKQWEMKYSHLALEALEQRQLGGEVRARPPGWLESTTWPTRRGKMDILSRL